MRRFKWPFQDLGFSLLLTGRKLATHEHLATLAPMGQPEIDDMRIWVEEAVQALALEDADRFVASARGFGRVLSETGRVADHTRALLEDLADFSGVRAAKGCGAMGSDIVLVLHDRSHGSSIEEFAADHGMRIGGTDANLVEGGAFLKQVVT
jgi:uncharacterized protein (DUF433 family)